jgi:hypothetical protein
VSRLLALAPCSTLLFVEGVALGGALGVDPD